MATRGQSANALVLSPSADVPLGEADIRLEDYLNDKLQTVADLGSLPSLIASVEVQKRQLEEQVHTLLYFSRQLVADHCYSYKMPEVGSMQRKGLLRAIPP